MRYITFLLAVVSFISSAQKVFIKNVLEKLPTSIRGLSVVNDHVVWFSGSMGHVGRSINGGVSWNVQQVKDFEKVDFRSLYAFDSLNAIIANAGSPASILKTMDGGKTWKEVYRNELKDIFLDGVDFWDAKRGIIYGDPIDGRMVLLKTNDGGNSWQEITKENRPALSEGEASFAASGTGIRCFDKSSVVIATGGNFSRLWISQNGGENWKPRDVPIIQGKASAGIFSIAQSSNKWIVVGGDFEVDTLKQRHILIGTTNGTSWSMPKKPTGGYRSGIEFITGKIWIAVGQPGADVSFTDGRTWESIPNEKALHVVRKARNGSRIFAAGNGRVAEIQIQK